VPRRRWHSSPLIRSNEVWPAQADPRGRDCVSERHRYRPSISNKEPYTFDSAEATSATEGADYRPRGGSTPRGAARGRIELRRYVGPEAGSWPSTWTMGSRARRLRPGLRLPRNYRVISRQPPASGDSRWLADSREGSSPLTPRAGEPLRARGSALVGRARPHVRFPRAQRLTAMPCISNRAVKSSVPAPMNARAGNSFLK
jgi:hypothetical protein